MSSIVKSVLSQFTDWIDVCYLIEYGLCLQHISYRCVLILVIAAFSQSVRPVIYPCHLMPVLIWTFFFYYYYYFLVSLKCKT